MWFSNLWRQERYQDFHAWNDVPFNMRKLDTPWTPNMTSGLNVPLPARKQSITPAVVRVFVIPVCLVLAILFLGL